MSATFSTGMLSKNWTLIVDGSTLRSFGVHLAGNDACYIAIAPAEPLAASDDFIELSNSAGGITALSLSILSVDRVYARAAGAAGTVLRGYKESR